MTTILLDIVLIPIALLMVGALATWFIWMCWKLIEGAIEGTFAILGLFIDAFKNPPWKPRHSVRHAPSSREQQI